MKALLDYDILAYEVGYSSEREGVISSWEWCKDILERKIDLICDEVQSDEPPTIFLTTSPKLNAMLNKLRGYEEEDAISYTPLLRNEWATTVPYKLGRKSEKPFHYNNIVSHGISNYDYVVAEDGLEADDHMCIYQMIEPPRSTIICSRDKDLRQCPGLHYSWECANQRSIGPHFTTPLGSLELKNKNKKPKLLGYGDKWFYSQMVLGDNVDNILGIKGCGPVWCYNNLNKCDSSEECFSVIKSMYIKTYKDGWEARLRENANLLYMIRELDDEGNPVLWKMPNLN